MSNWYFKNWELDMNNNVINNKGLDLKMKTIELKDVVRYKIVDETKISRPKNILGSLGAYAPELYLKSMKPKKYLQIDLKNNEEINLEISYGNKQEKHGENYTKEMVNYLDREIGNKR